MLVASTADNLKYFKSSKSHSRTFFLESLHIYYVVIIDGCKLVRVGWKHGHPAHPKIPLNTQTDTQCLSGFLLVSSLCNPPSDPALHYKHTQTRTQTHLSFPAAM